MNIWSTNGGKSSNIVQEMRPCTLEDFTNNGYNQEIPIRVDKLICPDLEKLGADYRLFNGYKSKKARVAFSIEIIACNNDFTEDCAPLDVT